MNELTEIDIVAITVVLIVFILSIKTHDDDNIAGIKIIYISMDKKSLQIGNIVNVPNWYRDGQDAYFRITSLSEEGNMIGVANGRILTSVSIDDIQPVELTIELMEKIGLERLKSNDFKIIDNVEIWFVSDGAHIAISGISVMRNPIRYLHELQNLHRLLCGVDLDFDLPIRLDGIRLKQIEELKKLRQWKRKNAHVRYSGR